MLRFHFLLVAASLFIASGVASESSDPPTQLVAENCAKAEAILEGRILSSHTPPNQFTETKFTSFEGLQRTLPL